MNRLSLFLSVTFTVGLSVGACETSDGADGWAGGGAGTVSGGFSGTSGGAGGTTSGGSSGTGGATGGSGGNNGGSGVGGSGGTGETPKGGTGGTSSTGGFSGESCNMLDVQGDWIETKSIPSSPGFQGGKPAPGLYYLTSAAIIDGNSSAIERWTVKITPEPNSIMEWSIESKAPDVFVSGKFSVNKIRYNATFAVNGNTLTITRTCNPTSPYSFKYTATANTLTFGYAGFVHTLTRQP